ncbi:MAG: ABC transporter substrate-binding protein [Micromonosporaceae bacterium]
MAASWRAEHAVTRRDFLRVTGGVAAAASVAGLIGCSGAERDPAADAIKIPDPKGRFPKGDVSFRLMDSNDTKGPFWEEFFRAYEKKHPNVKAKYDGLPWERIEEVAPLGFRNGSAHDVLQLPPSIPLTQAVGEGWLAPLEDAISDFDAWKGSFADEVFAEGVNVFDGKHYAAPLATEQRHFALLHYNSKLMEQAGYDPASKPLTWEDYRAAAKKITKQGKGRAYGVVFEIAQPPRLEFVVSYLARSAGVASVGTPAGYMDLKTGEFVYTQDGIAEAIELMLSLKADGSVFPGSNSLVAPESWPRVVRGNAGMVMGGPWVSALWEKENEAFTFGVASHPVADASGGIPPGYPVHGTDWVHVYAKSKVKDVAGDVLSYVNSVDGQKAWGKFVGAGNPPINDEARKAMRGEASAAQKRCLEIADTMVANPSVEIRNPDVALAYRERKPITPTFGELIQALFVGKTKDVKGSLKKLQDASDKALDDAIKAATKKGAKVSRDDWAFGNWDPSKPYTKADYDAL